MKGCFLMIKVRIKELMKRLDVSRSTIQRWDRENILKAHRTSTGRRYYLPEEIDEFEKKYLNN